MLRRLVVALVTVLVALVVSAAAAHACGYWGCTDYEYGTVCYWYPG